MSEATTAERDVSTRQPAMEVGRGFLEYLDTADAEERAAIDQLLAEDDPVMRALARAPMGPPDPPDARAAIELGKAMGAFVSGPDVTLEIERRRACEKAGP